MILLSISESADSILFFYAPLDIKNPHRLYQNSKISARKVLRKFGTEIMNKLRKFQYWARELLWKNVYNKKSLF